MILEDLRLMHNWKFLSIFTNHISKEYNTRMIYPRNSIKEGEIFHFTVPTCYDSQEIVENMI